MLTCGKWRVMSHERSSSAASVRPPAVAGTWYPGSAAALTSAVDAHLAAARETVGGDLVALVAPHAGLMYSGPVAAHAYHLLRGRTFDVAVLVGPSHFVGFDGVAIDSAKAWETPYGAVRIDGACAERIRAQSAVVVDRPQAHVREHSLEMQLPFLQRLAPDVPIVPLVMGYQTADTARGLGDALSAALAGTR